ncbi:translation elongation factor Ts [Hydrogenibacillus sp. N12]|uniref:translation elongation factor Ts n=1 Tax=Hydrogenibacillus sp. N12 TaxID=2866627 RepID=UPI001A05DB6A|nr:translation elongation factor Ts [Hydrogenibacillus sp. N12]MBE3562203.1 translation elongation factor Ts [Hydrogenibacillus schlegelii]QZA34127.1 translation elongation factor Ts [Hydrogenibacillus sp. N12]
MAITASMVKELRERTGAGMLECKKALEEAGGDMERAVQILRERGMAAAQKKAGRIAAEGLVESYIHAGGRIGVLVEVNCETDFVAKNDDFRAFVREVAMQIAANAPRYVSKEDVPEDVVAREKEIYRQQALNEGKPEAVVEKIVEGRMKNFYKEACLLEQPYIRDESKTVGELLNELVAKIGEKIVVRRFVRFELGEGIERKKEDFAEEVMRQVKA